MEKKSGFCPIGRGVIPANQEQCSSISRLLLGSQYQMGATPHPRLPPSRESSLSVVTQRISFLYFPQLLFDYIFTQPGATWSHQGRHLQSLLVISSNSTFPPPWLLQNVYSGNHYSEGLDLFTPEKFNVIPLLSSLPGLAGCKQRLTIILFYSSELS